MDLIPTSCEVYSDGHSHMHEDEVYIDYIEPHLFSAELRIAMIENLKEPQTWTCMQFDNAI